LLLKDSLTNTHQILSFLWHTHSMPTAQFEPLSTSAKPASPTALQGGVSLDHFAYAPGRLGPQFYPDTTPQKLAEIASQLERELVQKVAQLTAQGATLPLHLAVAVQLDEAVGYDPDILLPKGAELIHPTTGEIIRPDSSLRLPANQHGLLQIGNSDFIRRKHATLLAVPEPDFFVPASLAFGVFALSEAAPPTEAELAEEAEKFAQESLQPTASGPSAIFPKLMPIPTADGQSYHLIEMTPSAHPLQDHLQQMNSSHGNGRPQRGFSSLLRGASPFIRLALMHHLAQHSALSRSFKGASGAEGGFMPMVLLQGKSFTPVRHNHGMHFRPSDHAPALTIR
jgi:hypothetical protein